MTCPTCNDAGFIETRTSGGLVERKACADAWHAQPLSARGAAGGTSTVLDDLRPAPRPASWPFDPEPRALEPAQNGYIWCHGCESVRPVTHVHPAWTEAEVAEVERRGEELFWAFEGPVAAERAEFAESLLCAMAFDHGAWLGAREFRLMHCSYYVLGCVFCDATRGGGR